MKSKDSASLERERHECEVRVVLRMKDKDSRRKYLDGIGKRRGIPLMKQMERDVMNQWKKGNRGEWGDWL